MRSEERLRNGFPFASSATDLSSVRSRERGTAGLATSLIQRSVSSMGDEMLFSCNWKAQSVSWGWNCVRCHIKGLVGGVDGVECFADSVFDVRPVMGCQSFNGFSQLLSCELQFPEKLSDQDTVGLTGCASRNEFPQHLAVMVTALFELPDAIDALLRLCAPQPCNRGQQHRPRASPGGWEGDVTGESTVPS